MLVDTCDLITIFMPVSLYFSIQEWGTEKEKNTIKIKADMTLVNLFQLDELKSGSALLVDLP